MGRRAVVGLFIYFSHGSERHCDLALDLFLLSGLAAGAQFLFHRGPDTFFVSCFCGNQPSFLKQLGYQLSHKPLSHAVTSVLVAETADLKLFSHNDCDWVCNIQVGSFCSALFQDEVRDLPALCLQRGTVFGTYSLKQKKAGIRVIPALMLWVWYATTYSFLVERGFAVCPGRDKRSTALTDSSLGGICLPAWTGGALFELKKGATQKCVSACVNFHCLRSWCPFLNFAIIHPA